jgi:hypothetical protein
MAKSVRRDWGAADIDGKGIVVRWREYAEI